ncbi:hypothetical protein MNVI_36920 [Mycobacterium noviomagense]|uniref:Uncharacterized protein n=1 Tax=Mycobacterium noviomagense TaxID=459858 RepID=A0A7I7PIF1_9MYCO|nr:hypothetical protein MNVI_36920 [Mycobacterium noviomagense]
MAGALRFAGSSEVTRGRRRARTLGLCSRNQGGGLDFVSQRGYGRLRWLVYPAETNKIDETEESWPFPS